MTDASRRDVLAASAALAAAAAMPAFAQAQAQAQPAGRVPADWDLTELFPSDAAWQTERQAIVAALPRIATFKGRLGNDAATLKQALTTVSDLSKRASRVYTYASLKADEDAQVGANQELRQQAQAMFTDLGSATSWMDPELLKVGKARIDGFLRADPGLARFKFPLENTLRQAPHTLGEEAEQVLALASNPLSGPQEIRGQLVNSDIPWPEITLSTGEKVRLDAPGYTAHREAPNRADRKAVFDAFWNAHQTYKTSLGAALATQVQSNIFTAKARKYPNALASAISGDNIPEGVYRTLIEETNRGLPVLHRYFELRRRLLSLPDMHYYDIYPPLAKLDRKFTLDESRALTLAAVQPLGREYVDTFADASLKPWASSYPKKGKRSGAYMDPGAYDVHPYLLLNHTDNYESMSTYAHEWGHAMHSLLAAKAQPFDTANYATFTAEIASTLNEQLLVRHMVANAKTNAEKIFYLGGLLESFRGTFFRQTMFAEFELAINETVEKGQGLSGETLNEMYLALLKKYHGPRMTIDPVYASEWAYIQHFYFNFYVYQYATSLAASVFFDDQIARNGARAANTFLDVLRAGGSDYPVEILKRAGLDMTTPAPYRALVAKFSRTMDEVEALMA